MCLVVCPCSLIRFFHARLLLAQMSMGGPLTVSVSTRRGTSDRNTHQPYHDHSGRGTWGFYFWGSNVRVILAKDIIQGGCHVGNVLIPIFESKRKKPKEEQGFC